MAKKGENSSIKECTMAAGHIPIVDFSTWRLEGANPSADQVNDLAAQIHEAFSTIGFVYLTNHGIPQEMLNELYSKMGAFFALPHDVKSCYGKQGETRHLGYVAMEEENLNPESPGDLKETYNTIPFKDMIWPDEKVPGFQHSMRDFYYKCFELTNRVLRLMAVALGMENQHFFSEVHRCKENSKSVLRCLQYPPLPQGSLKAGQLRCGEHTDYGSITLLFQDNAGGLEVQTRAGQYVDAVPIPGAVVVNIGDMMQRWTADKLVSAKHRVRIPNNEEKKQQIRRSIAFFANPDMDAVIRCTDDSDKYPPITSGDFLKLRVNPTFSTG